MDITPQVINEVEFPLKVRGYDPDEVDDFLERMAVGVGQLQERLEQLSERAATAERRAAELEKLAREGGAERAPGAQAGGQASMTPAQETEQLSRTLAMAQRFVDQAMKEAQEEADRLVADATENSKRMHTETDVEIERLRKEAQSEIAEEVRRLEEARSSLQGDVEALTQHADDQRARLRASLADFERLLDDPDGLRTTAGPELSDAGLPEFARRLTAVGGRESNGSPSRSGAPPTGSPPGAEPGVPGGEGQDAALGEPPRPRAVPSPAEQGVSPTRRHPSRPEGEDDDAWARFAQGPEPVNEGPPTAVHLVEGGGDPYLSELRRAMGGEAPAAAPAAPEVDGPPFNQDDDPTGPRRRFERR